MSHHSYVSPRFCLTKPYVSRGLCLTDLMSHGGLMSQEAGSCLKDQAGETHHVLPGVTPERAGSENFAVSRAAREILSLLGDALMYRQCAYVSPFLCLTALMSHETLCLTGLMSHRPYVSRVAYVSRDGLMSHRRGRRIVPDACRCRTWSVGVRSPSRFLSRHAKSSALLALP